jgi:serine/threonine protein kinase
MVSFLPCLKVAFVEDTASHGHEQLMAEYHAERKRFTHVILARNKGSQNSQATGICVALTAPDVLEFFKILKSSVKLDYEKNANEINEAGLAAIHGYGPRVTCSFNKKQHGAKTPYARNAAIIMTLLRRPSLAAYFKEIESREDKVVEMKKVVPDMKEKVQAIHWQDKLHQDLHGDNLGMDENGVVVLDFGSMGVEGVTAGALAKELACEGTRSDIRSPETISFAFLQEEGKKRIAEARMMLAVLKHSQGEETKAAAIEDEFEIQDWWGEIAGEKDDTGDKAVSKLSAAVKSLTKIHSDICKKAKMPRKHKTKESDRFSLGVFVFEALEGRHPFESRIPEPVKFFKDHWVVETFYGMAQLDNYRPKSTEGARLKDIKRNMFGSYFVQCATALATSDLPETAAVLREVGLGNLLAIKPSDRKWD